MEKQKSIIQLLPQKPPFLMVDELTSSKYKSFSSSFKIDNKNIFIEDNKLSVSGIIENMGQTAMAGIISTTKEEKGTEIDGYLAGVKQFEVFKRPPINSIIVTKILVKAKIDKMFLISCEVFNQNELVAKALLQITSK